MAHSTIIKTDRPFLVHQPVRKRRAPKPLPLQSIRRGSSTFSTIAAWTSNVQPGSPASLSPRSPHRCHASPGKVRRPSVTSIGAASASFLHIVPTPTTALVTTPTVYDLKADLTAVGYTSVFLQLPNTPVSARLSFSIKSPSSSGAKGIPIPPIPSPTCKPRGFARFRSLSVLRSRGRSKSVCSDSRSKMKAKAKAAASAAIIERKKAKYAMRPPPLANELALMQFTDGGSVDDNIKRVMEARAKAAGVVGLADIYRDGKGGIWWDQDEEWEYTHLLDECNESRYCATGDLQWATFNTPTVCVPGDERRGSVSTQDSDLDPKYMVQPVDMLDCDDRVLSGDVTAPLPVACKSGIAVLSLPSRPRHAANHLQKPNFLVDVGSSHPRAPSPQSPKSRVSSGTRAGFTKPKGKARRRPAPLKLSQPSPAFQVPTNPLSPVDPDKVRQDFIEASFKPVPILRSVSTPVTPATAVATIPFGRLFTESRRGGTNGGSRMKKPSMLNMMGLFQRSGR